MLVTRVARRIRKRTDFLLLPPRFLVTSVKRIRYGGSVWESNPNGILKTLFLDRHTHRNMVDEVPRRCLDKFFFGKCSDKFAVFVFVEFTEPDWVEHSDTII